ncbi:hypothetical protein K1719_023342 [Acacia pycnantha]|nr:hypothetical protein K1719_023342 [Acacia pycnantha]
MKALISPAQDGCVEKVTEVVKSHNEALSEALHELEAQLQGFKYSYIDFYTSLTERIKSTSKYGFKERKIGCCGGGPYKGRRSCGGKRTVKEYEVCNEVADYLIFDSLHPTEKAYHQISELIWNEDYHNVAQPYNLKEFYQL